MPTPPLSLSTFLVILIPVIFLGRLTLLSPTSRAPIRDLLGPALADLALALLLYVLTNVTLLHP